MKNVKIAYNPYLLRTHFLIDGKEPAKNSPLNFGSKRLQEWSEDLAKRLVQECSDRNFNIEFTGLRNDFEDLKASLDSENNFNYKIQFNEKPSVDKVEAEIGNIFNEIQRGPIPQLKDKSIKEAFDHAKNQQFEIDVIATMSSGKSTLINALLGKKLMPVANEATTATIVRIINDSSKANGVFSGIAYDKNGRKVKEDNNLTYKTMKDWNDDNSISTIDIKGKILCVESVGMNLVLVDTPGPNNSQDESHQRKTYDMLEKSDKSLVLFVLNGGQLNINDQKTLMDYVCSTMEKGGKQSRERYIFALNQMDRYDPENEENPKDALDSAKKVLEQYKIYSPNLFPVSALGALECRTNPKIPHVLPIFREQVKAYDEMKFDSYYNYNNLPVPIKQEIEGWLDGGNENDRLEIHTGIVSIEEAIKQYVSKYARALKVMDLVSSFNSRLTELKAVSEVQAEIRKNENKKAQLDSAIQKIKESIDSGRSAKDLSALIDKKDLSGEVRSDIRNFIGKTLTNINSMILRSPVRVEKNQALRQIETIQKDSKEILVQMDSHISSILERGYKNLFEDILDTYRDYLSKLGMKVSGTDMEFKPLDFAAEELNDLDSLINENTDTVDEGHDEARTRRVRGERKTNWFWEPWNWGTERYEYHTENYTVHISNLVDYVDVRKVVTDYLQPLQLQLRDAQKAAEQHAESETKRLKEMLIEQIQRIDSMLKQKMDDLQQSTRKSQQTAEVIRKQQENLKWMKSIISRVNNLVNF